MRRLFPQNLRKHGSRRGSALELRAMARVADDDAMGFGAAFATGVTALASAFCSVTTLSSFADEGTSRFSDGRRTAVRRTALGRAIGTWRSGTGLTWGAGSRMTCGCCSTCCGSAARGCGTVMVALGLLASFCGLDGPQLWEPIQ